MIAPAQDTTKPVKPLSAEERAAFVEIDLIIKKNHRDEEFASLEKCKAFARAAQGRLYREFKTMAAFGLSYGIKPSVTSKLKKSGRVYYNLASLWEEDGVVAPTSAWQLLPLARLKNAEDQRHAWEAAVRLSGGGVPSETKVEEAVAELCPPKPEKADPVTDPLKDPSEQLTLAVRDFTNALKELSPKIKATVRPAMAKRLRSLEKLSGRYAAKMELSKLPSRRLPLPKMRAFPKVAIDPEMQEDLTNLMVAGFFGS